MGEKKIQELASELVKMIIGRIENESSEKTEFSTRARRFSLNERCTGHYSCGSYKINGCGLGEHDCNGGFRCGHFDNPS